MASSMKDQSEGTFGKLKSSFREIFGKLERPKLDTAGSSEKSNENNSEKAGPE